eukprot:1919839-Alexandrium_andersonii.AAC.1
MAPLPLPYQPCTARASSASHRCASVNAPTAAGGGTCSTASPPTSTVASPTTGGGIGPAPAA